MIVTLPNSAGDSLYAFVEKLFSEFLRIDLNCLWGVQDVSLRPLEQDQMERPECYHTSTNRIMQNVSPPIWCLASDPNAFLLHHFFLTEEWKYSRERGTCFTSPVNTRHFSEAQAT